MNSNSHHCKALVLQCIDYRFRRILYDYFSVVYPEGYDLVSVAGGVKDLLGDESASNYLMNQLMLSCKLHGPDIIVLVQHEDCGAYGESVNFKSKEAEEKFQQNELDRAEDLLKNCLPETQILKYYARLSGEIMQFSAGSQELVHDLREAKL